MRRTVVRFMVEEAGFVTSPEWAFVATILVLGAITGLLASRHAPERDVPPPIAVQPR
jgi:hypothetical protein